MGKVRHREIKKFAQDHTAIKQQKQNLKLSCTVAESVLLTILSLSHWLNHKYYHRYNIDNKYQFNNIQYIRRVWENSGCIWSEK